MQLYNFVLLLNESKYRQKYVKSDFFESCRDYFCNIRAYVDPEIVNRVDNFIRRLRLTIQLLPKEADKKLEEFVKQNHKHPTDKAILEKLKELSKSNYNLDEFDFRISFNAIKQVKRLWSEQKHIKFNKPLSWANVNGLILELSKGLDHKITEKERVVFLREFLGEILEIDLEGTPEGDLSILDGFQILSSIITEIL